MTQPTQPPRKSLLTRLADVRAWVLGAPPWLASLLVHFVVVLMLAGLSASASVAKKPPVVVDTRIEQDLMQPEFSQVLNVLDASAPMEDSLSFTKAGVSVGQELGDPSFNTGSAAGTAFGSTTAAASPIIGLDRNRKGPSLAGPGGMGISTGVKIDTHVAIKGGTDTSAGVGGGVSGAIDRITYEIARSLDDRKTLVIWLLDATASLKTQREELASRIDRVYEELGVLKKDQQRALLTAIVEFGQKDRPLTAEPTADVEEIKKAIRAVKEDESGTENVFTAIMNSLGRWGKYRTMDKRNIMVIAMTDERGDDEAKVEEAMVKAKSVQAKVYVVGAAAPLGRPTVRLPWPSEGEVLAMLPADRGPESAKVERDALPFWSDRQTAENISSGFGPWALSRLCRDSGGIYFMMQDRATVNTYEPAALRAYQPDYVPRKEYERMLTASPIRKAVVSVADMTSKGPQTIPAIPLEFPADDAQLNRAMGDGQAVMARIQYFIEPSLKAMQAVEKDRDREKSRRWRAQYDLLLGRLLAAKVRTYTYNAMCAAMKKKKKEFEKPDSNMWRLASDSSVPDDTPAGPKLVEAAEKARQLLNRVADENPGTPWADFAKKELATDLGFKWVEFSRPVEVAGARPNAPRPPAKPAPKAPAKPAAPPAKVPTKI